MAVDPGSGAAGGNPVPTAPEGMINANVNPLSKIGDHNVYGFNNNIDNKTITFHELAADTASNLMFNMSDQNWYNKFNRYGWIDPYDTDRVTKEYLFFTKPDCNIFDSDGSGLVPELKANPYIYNTWQRRPSILYQLEHLKYDGGSYLKDPAVEYHSSFMNILSNAVMSKLDLPNISVESMDSTPTIMGTSIQYRGHSFKGGGYDFSLTFHDTAYLEVYMLAKCYDEYIRMIRMGDAQPKKQYIENHILSDQFSIYKIDVGSDGETILFWAKLTGCYFTDVPRDVMGDAPEDGFKFSLSFHAHFVEDMNPQILDEFNYVAARFGTTGNRILPVFDSEHIVNNEWGIRPYIVAANQTDEIYGKRVRRRNSYKEYFLKWMGVNSDKEIYDSDYSEKLHALEEWYNLNLRRSNGYS